MTTYQENLDSLLLWMEDLRDQLEHIENLDKAELYSTLKLIQRRAQATAELIED